MSNEEQNTNESNTGKPAATTASHDIAVQAVVELKEGLIALQHQNESRMSAQERKLAELYEDLEGAFSKIHHDTNHRDSQSRTHFDELSTTIIRSSEELRKEYEELERLQDKRIEAESQQYSHGLKRTKIIAVPAVILAFLALIYMFYTVHVMEKAMTQMSQDINNMRKDMTQLTRNVGAMRQDMTLLTRNVSANMGGMRTRSRDTSR